MTQILLGYDASTDAERAVSLVAGLPWTTDTTVRVATAVPDAVGIRSAWGRFIAGDPGALEESLAARALETLAAPRDRLLASAVPADALVLRGRPAQALAAHASEWPADLVVVGSRGLGPASSTILGSVSAEVVDAAPCPVLVARTESVAKIVLATDGSEYARRTESFLATVPLASRVPVIVVSVAHVVRAWATGIAPTMTSDVLQAQVEQEDEARRFHAGIAEDAAARLRAAGIDASSDVASGDPGTEILAAADAAGADLIVVGSRGQTGLRRLVLGSVARRVLHHAETSVLVVRTAATADLT